MPHGSAVFVKSRLRTYSASAFPAAIVLAEGDPLLQSALSAEVEIRFLEEGQSAHGVLARTSQITDASANGAVITHEAPFPPLARGERRLYRVWLHVRASDQEHGTARLVVEVSGAGEGQRVRVIATGP